MSEAPSMAEQFSAIINPRLERVSKEVTREVAGIFDKQMKQNTREGRAFGNDQYESEYQSKSHKRARRRAGLQTGKVNLRFKSSSIDNTNIETTSGKNSSATIRFEDKGDIFKMHHTGRANGEYVRSIWPKTPESIPDSIKSQVKEMVGEILSGKK